MAKRLTQLPQSNSIGSNDYFDTSKDMGNGFYKSHKVTFNTLKQSIPNRTTVIKQEVNRTEVTKVVRQPIDLKEVDRLVSIALDNYFNIRTTMVNTNVEIAKNNTSEIKKEITNVIASEIKRKLEQNIKAQESYLRDHRKVLTPNETITKWKKQMGWIK